MGTVHDFQEAQNRKRETGSPKRMTFFSPSFTQNNEPAAGSFSVSPVDSADVESILDQVKERGGMWNDDMTAFIPYPCAFILVEDEE